MDCFKILHLPTAAFIKYDAIDNSSDVTFYSYDRAKLFLHNVVKPEDRCRYSIMSVSLDKDVINYTNFL